MRKLFLNLTTNNNNLIIIIIVKMFTANWKITDKLNLRGGFVITHTP